MHDPLPMSSPTPKRQRTNVGLQLGVVCNQKHFMIFLARCLSCRMPDPDFSVNDVRLCVGKCLLLFGDHHSVPELRPGQTGRSWESLGVSKLEVRFCGSPSVQLVEHELSFASGSQLLPA